MENDLAVRIVLFAALLGCGALMLWMARAGASGRLKRNPIAGIRVPATMASDEAWLAAHVRAKRPTTYAGFVAMASAVFALLPVSAPVLAVGVLLGAVGMLGFVLYGAVVGSRAAAQTQSSS